MNTILKPLLAKVVLFYLDDIIVIAPTFEEQLRLLRDFFTLLGNWFNPLNSKLQKTKNLCIPEIYSKACAVFSHLLAS